MDRELLDHFLADGARRGPEGPGAFTGSAGGAPCGDLVRISLALDTGGIDSVTFDAEGCAASRAAAAAVAELVDGAWFLEASSVDPAEVADALGGLAASHL
ncbi:MAG: iron-sulfur cluster assembly scaffold protein, partial [Solirubrobacterales bacterium]